MKEEKYKELNICKIITSWNDRITCIFLNGDFKWHLSVCYLILGIANSICLLKCVTDIYEHSLKFIQFCTDEVRSSCQKVNDNDNLS